LERSYRYDLQYVIVAKAMEEIQKRWYVVRSVSGKEKKVKEHLELEINRHKLSDYVSQVLIPTEKVFQIRNGKKISRNVVTSQVMF